ncbi:MAG TPA: metalloregulator ArsR/SmtB family transcription factor [Methanoregulaceae archaeon]|nr:metalloregulator ArsR/SmtB family transcription factor [Methanoregulaceae archaeon]
MSDITGNDTTSRIPRPIQEEIDKCGGTAGFLGRLPKDQELRSIAVLHSSLSDVIRLKILFLLGVQPLCVCVIRDIIGISDSKLSYHLTILKKAGLIKGEQQGSWIIYSITGKGTTYTKPGEDHSYPSYYTVGD